MAFRLVIQDKDAPAGTEAETRDFDQAIVTMGRHSSNDIQVTHSGASRQHCKIILEDGNYFLIDPGSANGTVLNGRKIPLKRNQLLKDNDLIAVEAFEFRFKTMNRVAVKGPGENTDEVALRVVREVLGSLQAKNNPYLEVISGPNKGKIIEFDKDVQQVIIGRSDSCDLVLNDAMISRRNAKIRRDWSGITATDLNSKNGTFVNGDKITERPLKDGDEVRIGESRIYFRNPREAFGKEVEEDSAGPALNRDEPIAPVLPASPPPKRAPILPPTPQPSMPSLRDTGNLADEVEAQGYEADAGPIWQNFEPKDYAFLAIGAIVLLVGLIFLLKFFF